MNTILKQDIEIETSEGLYRLSSHARCRRDQRALTNDAIRAAIEHGRQERAGRQRTIHWIGAKEVRKANSKGINITQYHKVAVVTAKNHKIITVTTDDSPKGLRKRAKQMM